MQTCVLGEFISTTNDKMQKNSVMFFCFCRRTIAYSIAKGVLQLCRRSFSTESKKQFRQKQKNKSVHMGPKLAPNETLNLMQLGQMAIESVLLVISIMASLVAQAVTMPTAALAVEAGPLRGKRERTEGMPHRELVQYPVRITVRKYASRCGCSGCSWPLDSSCKLAITWGEAHDANEAPRRSNRRLD